jgi:hypothetical protein
MCGHPVVGGREKEGETQMRIPRTYVVAALAAIGALAVSASALAAPGDVIQTLNSQVSPGKLPKSDDQNAKLHIDVSGCYEGATPGQCREETPRNPDASRVIFGFDRKDIEFNTGEAKRCKSSPEQIANLSPDQAKSACGNGSVIGKGSAKALAGSTEIPATVTAFNGKKKAGKPTIYLHAYASSVGVGTVPVGTLKPGNKLDVKVDPLLSGAARLQQFEVDVRKGAYIQASCSDKKISTTSKWTYRDAPGVTVNDTQKCTVKR